MNETLAMCKRIKDSIPGVRKIWEVSMADKLKTHLLDVELFQQRAYAGLLEKKYTKDTPSVRNRVDYGSF